MKQERDREREGEREEEEGCKCLRDREDRETEKEGEIMRGEEKCPGAQREMNWLILCRQPLSVSEEGLYPSSSSLIR